jgi:transcription elongation factor GreA
MDPITMTAEELETVQRELRQLESAGRREIAARIKTAREWGDLKENAEYHAAKEDQAHLETQIIKLREQVRNAAVVELVSPHDARPSEGVLSVASPVAKALIGRRPGDVIEVQTPNGVRKLSIDSVS